MLRFPDRCAFLTNTTGTGPITPAGALPLHQTPAVAGIGAGDSVRYAIEDGTQWEVGTGTFDAAGIMSRSPDGIEIDLSGEAVVFITIAGINLTPATIPQLCSPTPNRFLDSAGGYGMLTPLASSGSGSISLDLAARRMFVVTLTGNATLEVPSNMTVGQMGEIDIVMDATGGRILALGAGVKFRGDYIAPDTAGNARTTYGYRVREGNVFVLTYGGIES